MQKKHPFALWLVGSGLTARQIAQELGVSRTAIYNWTYGVAPSTKHLAELIRISKGGVQPWMWLGEESSNGN
jgi:transcriptional regulator with XRE-family HTH domain